MGDLANKLRAALNQAPPPKKWKRRPEILCLPNIPPPMYGLAPRVVLGQKWWDETRQEAYRSTDFHCIACGVHQYSARFHQWMEGHEVYDTDYLLGRLTYVETVPLCHSCHCFIHDGRLKWQLGLKEITATKYLMIMNHGRRVLKQAGIVKPPLYSGPVAEWEDWRLVVFDKEYKPLFASREEWEKENAKSAKPPDGES